MFREISLLEDNEDYIKLSGINTLFPELQIDNKLWKIPIRSKNKVYKISTDKGPGIIKLIRKQPDAVRELWATKYLPTLNHISRYIPKALNKQTSNVLLDGTQLYINIIEDITAKVDDNFVKFQDSDQSDDALKYIKHNLELLVNIHVEGTKLFQLDNQNFKSRRLFRPQLYGRIERTLGVDGISYLKDLNIQSLEDRGIFIHQDPKHNNRMGQYLVDWGNCGRGNYLMDIVRMFEEHQFRKHVGLKIEDMYPILKEYWEIRNEKMPNLETEFMDYCKLAYLHNVTEIDCLKEYGITRDANEDNTLKYMEQSLPNLKFQIDKGNNSCK